MNKTKLASFADARFLTTKPETDTLKYVFKYYKNKSIFGFYDSVVLRE